jgi:hypothetical protein
MRRILLLLTLIAAAGCTEEPATPDGKSTDLARDLEWMWETRPLESSGDPTQPPNPRASTDRAIEAADRVFATVDLTGKTTEEVYATLGRPEEKSDSIYNFPFYPVEENVLVFRFDNGAWGTQYNVIFDDEGKVASVEELGIE